MASPPDTPEPRRFWIVRFGWTVPLICGAIVGVALRLFFSATPDHAMESSFTLLVPILVGAVTVYMAERAVRRSWSYYFFAAAAANALFVVGTMVIRVEGLICAILAIPLFGFVGGLGGVLMGAVCRWTKWPRAAVYTFAALPLLLGGLEQNLPLPQDIRSVDRVRIVSASPERVWTHLTVARGIRAEEIGSAWMYRIGVPLPSSAVTELADSTQVRHITMGKGIQFDQVAADWQPNQRVRWTYRFRNDSFPPGALDDHVKIGGRYVDLIDTEYVLREVNAGTEIRVTMRYRVSTAFNWYAQPIADFLVGNFEEAALRFYATRAEGS
ncbi:MAG TPA: hypothetical protein VLW26_04395 [Steroidobacteraceae bacterium]|nr:hypothetical protein [Steroidobacteraceae bacterium]